MHTKLILVGLTLTALLAATPSAAASAEILPLRDIIDRIVNPPGGCWITTIHGHTITVDHITIETQDVCI